MSKQLLQTIIDYCKVQTKLKYNQMLKKMYILMSNLSNYSKQFCVKMEFDEEVSRMYYRIEEVQ